MTMLTSIRNGIIAGLTALALIGVGIKAADLGNAIYSETDASNSASTLFPEGMAPSAVNDNMRGLIGALYRWYDHSQATTVSTGSSNAYVLTYVITPAQYATGDVYSFRSNFTNTGTSSLNINGLGVRSITVGPGRDALQANDIMSGQIVSLSYDVNTGTFQMVSPPRGGIHQNNLSSTGSGGAYNLTYTSTPIGYITGQNYFFRASFSLTGAGTLNINGLGAKAITKSDSSTGLQASDIRSGQMVEVIYNGTSDNFQLNTTISPVVSSVFATQTSLQSNMTGDGTQFTFIANNEIYDLNSDYNASTGVYTWPVDGKLQIEATVMMGGMTALDTGGQIGIVATNRTLWADIKNPGAQIDTGGNHSFHISAIVDGTAGQTASVVLLVSGSTKTVDTFVDSGANVYDHVSFRLFVPN